nr:4786_t:CDS:2 [Entrophospora candida]
MLENSENLDVKWLEINLLGDGISKCVWKENRRFHFQAKKAFLTYTQFDGFNSLQKGLDLENVILIEAP